MFEKLLEKFKQIPKIEQEPFFVIKGERIDPEQGLIMEYDWNDEFIQYLKSKGYNGTSEDVIIEKWIKSVFYDIIQRESQNEFF